MRSLILMITTFILCTLLLSTCSKPVDKLPKAIDTNSEEKKKELDGILLQGPEVTKKQGALSEKQVELVQEEYGHQVPKYHGHVIDNGLKNQIENEYKERKDGAADPIKNPKSKEPIEKNIEGGAGDGNDEDDEDEVEEDEQNEKMKFKSKGKHKLTLESLEPPDHLDAVRMEQDGHLNKDYKKEIFFGNHEEFESGTTDQMKNKLKDIFFRVDSNGDMQISVKEMEEWIIQKVQEHFEEAQEENEKVFALLDTNDDGFIAWSEFRMQYLIAKGYLKEGEIVSEKIDDDKLNLGPEEKEYLVRNKFRWSEADDNPEDNQLDLIEFQSFRHPESNKKMMLQMVDGIMDNLDINHNGEVSMEEFVSLPLGDVESNWENTDEKWQEERKKEFSDVIDLNRDGKVSKDELLNYVDPKNPNHAILEARNLVSLADTNHDNKLSMAEVLDNMEIFLASKMVNTGQNFHDEF